MTAAWITFAVLLLVLAAYRAEEHTRLWRQRRREDRACAVLRTVLGPAEEPSPVAARPDPETFVAARRNAERWMP